MSHQMQEAKVWKLQQDVIHFEEFLNQTDQIVPFRMKLNGTYPTECQYYRLLNHPTRYSGMGTLSGQGQLCDKVESSVNGRDFRGLDWYRIIGPAGTKLAGREQIEAL